MNFEIDKYNQYNLPEGHKYSICPICSENRKKEKQKCMLLDWKTGLGTCQHCGEVVQLHTYKANGGFAQNHLKSAQITPKVVKKSINEIPKWIYTASLKNYSQNNFYHFLVSVFGDSKTKQIIKEYPFGTSKYKQSATVFWQIDQAGKIRAGKVMLYNKLTGKRIKNIDYPINWVQHLTKIENYEMEQCFFGEHLLTTKKPVAIVESEKTAIIASVYFPKYTWLAVGGLNNLSANRCKVLKGRTVLLYPDLKAYHEWEEKAHKIAQTIDVKFEISDFLERHASEEERKNGLDLADFLLRFPWEEPQEPLTKNQQKLNALIEINPLFTAFIKAFDLQLID